MTPEEFERLMSMLLVIIIVLVGIIFAIIGINLTLSSLIRHLKNKKE